MATSRNVFSIRGWGLDKNGVITAIDSRHVDDCGAYPRYEPLGCVYFGRRLLPGAYRVKNVRIDMNQVVTNKCPVGPNRGVFAHAATVVHGAGAGYFAGHTLGIPTDEMRQRNYIRKEENALYDAKRLAFYDSGDYAGHAGAGVKNSLAGTSGKKKTVGCAQKEGRWIGIGNWVDAGTPARTIFGQAQIINNFAPFFRAVQGGEYEA